MSPRVRKVKAVAEEENPRREVTYEEIAARAYEIHCSGLGGNDVENWIRAEEELNAELNIGQESQDEARVHVAA